MFKWALLADRTQWMNTILTGNACSPANAHSTLWSVSLLHRSIWLLCPTYTSPIFTFCIWSSVWLCLSAHSRFDWFVPKPNQSSVCVRMRRTRCKLSISASHTKGYLVHLHGVHDWTSVCDDSRQTPSGARALRKSIPSSHNNLYHIVNFFDPVVQKVTLEGTRGSYSRAKPSKMPIITTRASSSWEHTRIWCLCAHIHSDTR